MKDLIHLEELGQGVFVCMQRKENDWLKTRMVAMSGSIDQLLATSIPPGGVQAASETSAWGASIFLERSTPSCSPILRLKTSIAATSTRVPTLRGKSRWYQRQEQCVQCIPLVIILTLHSFDYCATYNKSATSPSPHIAYLSPMPSATSLSAKPNRQNLIPAPTLLRKIPYLPPHPHLGPSACAATYKCPPPLS